MPTSLRLVHPRRFPVNQPVGPLDAVLARQILLLSAAMYELDPPPDDDDDAIAAARATLTGDSLYVRWQVERAGVTTHELVVYPESVALAFVAGTTELAARLEGGEWAGGDPALMTDLPAAFAAMQLAEQERLRAAHAAVRAQRGDPAPVSLTGGPDVGEVTFTPLPPVDADQLDEVDQRRAALCWRFVGEGDGDIATLEELLSADGFRRWDVRDANDVTLATWWGGGDCGLLFRGGSAELIGEAIQHGFVCRDHALWRSIGAAASAPGAISWAPPDELIAGGDRLWRDPPDPEPLRAALFGDG